MCGRFTVTSPGEALREVEEAFGARVDVAVDQAELARPRWNVAPTQLVPIVQWRDGERAPLVTLARWGLVRREHPAPQINVRRETLGGGRAAALVRQGRALVLADGFYEWRADGVSKVPIWFSPRRPVWLAGLLDVGEVRGAPTLCAAIVTRPPAPLVAPVHDRMPAILDRDVARAWLDPRTPDAAARELLVPLPDLEAWTATEVSARVNSVKNDDAACLEPAPAKQLGLF